MQNSITFPLIKNKPRITPELARNTDKSLPELAELAKESGAAVARLTDIVDRVRGRDLCDPKLTPVDRYNDVDLDTGSPNIVLNKALFQVPTTHKWNWLEVDAIAEMRDDSSEDITAKTTPFEDDIHGFRTYGSSHDIHYIKDADGEEDFVNYTTGEKYKISADQGSLTVFLDS